MKKLLYIFLLATASILPQDITGTGTTLNPYILYNAADLDSIHQLGVGKHYRLANDINASGLVWTPLTITGADTFSLDGAGYKIDSLTILNDNTSVYRGFIGSLTTGAGVNADTLIQNLHIDHWLLHYDSTSTYSSGTHIFYALLVGYVNATTSGSTNRILIYNVHVNRSTVWVTNNSGSPGNQSRMGILFGGGTNTATSLDFERVGIDSCTAYGKVTGTFGGGMSVGGFMGGRTSNGMILNLDYCYIKNSYVQQDHAAAIYEYASTAAFASLVMGQQAVVTLTDCYVYNNTLRSNGIMGGSSDPPTAGIIGQCGTQTGVRFYVAANNYVRDNAAVEANSDFLGWYIGKAASVDDASSGILDTTGLYATDWYGVYGEGSTVGVGDSIQFKTTAQMQTLSPYTGWDFDGIWKLDPTMNGGYPALRWEPITNAVYVESPNGGESLTFGDTYTIEWSFLDTPADVYIWYSTNNGGSWTYIDSALSTDTTYSWTVPNRNSSQGLIYITSTDSTLLDESDANFYFIPGPQIEIFYPDSVHRTIALGDTVHIDMWSVNVDSILLYYSQDEMATWNFIAGTAVDTTNGFLQDTTTYVWTINILHPGDIYFRAITQADTAVYYDTSSVDVHEIDVPYNVPPVYCTYNGLLLTPLEWQFWEDPSCGWASPPHTARSGVINEDGTDYDIITNSTPCTGSCDSYNEFPYRTSVWLVSGSDTIETSMNTFYSNRDNDTLIYKNRRYWYNSADSSLYMDDLINGIDSMKIVDFAANGIMGDYWDSHPFAMQIYNVQYTKISGDTLSASLDFESLNDPLFVPKIVMMASGVGAWNLNTSLTVTLLGTPNNQAYAEGSILGLVDPAIQRFYFRGIHPKAEKR